MDILEFKYPPKSQKELLAAVQNNAKRDTLYKEARDAQKTPASYEATHSQYLHALWCRGAKTPQV